MSNEIATPRTMSTGLTRATQDEHSMVPAFMREEGVANEGLSLVQEYVVPPRVKIIQKQADEKYAAFKPGDVILTPQMIRIASIDEAFFFVPLLFYVEFCTVNPIQMKGTLPMIRARSFDPRSDIARKSRMQQTREETCPENAQLKIVHREYLSFIVLLFGSSEPALNGVPIAMSFASGEHFVGTQMSSLITMRKPAPIYGNVLQGKVPTTQRKNQKGSWYGIDVTNPAPESGAPPFIQDPEEFAALRAFHQRVDQQYKDKLIHIDYEDEGVDEAALGAEAKF